MMLRYLLPAVLLLCSQSAWSDEADHYNRAVFESVASRQVNNDLLVARMSVEINDKQPARIAQQITATLNEATRLAGSFSTVKVATGYQRTEAVYDKNNLFTGYRGHAEFRLESRDFEASSKLIALLQDKMQLAAIDFSVSPETQKQIESVLLAEAMDEFKKRADAVRRMMNGQSYKYVMLNINPGGRNFAQDGMLARNFEAKAIPMQKLSGGQSEIRVQVAGTIEIVP